MANHYFIISDRRHSKHYNLNSVTKEYKRLVGIAPEKKFHIYFVQRRMKDVYFENTVPENIDVKRIMNERSESRRHFRSLYPSPPRKRKPEMQKIGKKPILKLKAAKKQG